MTAHPIADLFPLLKGEELQALADDIKENGLYEAILVFEGEIIDGRNRWRACKMAGVEPRIEERIISKNLRRRHLTLRRAA
jgi:ParB-like chromosome segregation protein Spo0J